MRAVVSRVSQLEMYGKRKKGRKLCRTGAIFFANDLPRKMHCDERNHPENSSIDGVINIEFERVFSIDMCDSCR